MNNKLSVGCVLVIALGLAAYSVPCKACGIPYYWGYGCGNCAAWDYSTTHVPYFAVHPPVYYSYPIAYPYGFSPAPNPPCMPLADESSPAPQTYTAGHLPPLRIVNPYVERNKE